MADCLVMFREADRAGDPWQPPRPLRRGSRFVDANRQPVERWSDAAWKLGVPSADRKKFLVGYGSTLRNVGRIAESIERLQAAVAELPEVAALPAFLALSLHSAGRHDEAMVAALDAVLRKNAATSALDGYERALSHYRDEIDRARRE